MKKSLLSAALSVLFAASSLSFADAAVLKYTEDMEKAEIRPVYLSGEKPVSDDDGQNVVRVGFTGLEERVTKNNLTLKSIRKNITGIMDTDVDAQFDVQEIQYNMQIEQAQSSKKAAEKLIQQYRDQMAANPGMADTCNMLIGMQNGIIKSAESSIQAATMAIKGIDSARESAEDSLGDQTVTAKKALENTEKQLAVAAQSTYIGIVSMNEQLTALDRQLAALDRNIKVLEKQVEIGMGAQINLDNLRQARKELASGIEGVKKTKSQTEDQLALLCGFDNGTTVSVGVVPSVYQKDLDTINYEEDLKTAMKNSYSIWVKNDDMRSASNDYEDDVTSSVDFFESAKILLENEKINVENKFRALYDDIKEKQRLFEEAKGAFENQDKNFRIASTKYQRGMISKNAYLDAQDELEAKRDDMEQANHNLFTAYNTYDWARKGFMT